MREALKAFYEAHPEPAPAIVPIEPSQLDRIDDNLHYGWSWHRYRFCYRRAERLRVLDAGCGTGLSTLGLARLNPGAAVVGLDASPEALALAARRADASKLDVAFRKHELDERLPGGLGPFDFIVCRGVLGHAEESERILESLARVLDERGLLLATFPAREGRAAVRQLRRAVEILSLPEASFDERVQTGLLLFQSLRADHPIRRYEARFSGTGMPSAERLIAGYLGPDVREWSLEETIALVERAGLRFLYAAANRPWRAEPALVKEVPDSIKTRIGKLPERDQAILIDALDPMLHGDEYRLYACLAEFEPRLPGWPEERRKAPEVFDRLIPHRTGLAEPARPALGPGLVASQPVQYRAINGGGGPIDPLADARFRAVDGRRSCGEIDQWLAATTGVAEDIPTRQARWLELAGFGFVLLESPDPRQHVDCVHLGPVRDRLECPCPRRWVRTCERHEFCCIDPIDPGDEQFAALQSALVRLGVGQVVACARCADYIAEDYSET